MEVNNQLNEVVKTMVCGVPYSFEPGETKTIYNMDHFRMFNKKKNLGLVPLFYNDQEANKYETYEDYVQAKREESLIALFKNAEDQLRYEQQAASEMESSKKATTFEKNNLNIAKFERRFEEIGGELSKLRKKKAEKAEKAEKKAKKQN